MRSGERENGAAERGGESARPVTQRSLEKRLSKRQASQPPSQLLILIPSTANFRSPVVHGSEPGNDGVLTPPSLQLFREDTPDTVQEGLLATHYYCT